MLRHSLSFSFLEAKMEHCIRVRAMLTPNPKLNITWKPNTIYKPWICSLTFGCKGIAGPKISVLREGTKEKTEKKKKKKGTSEKGVPSEMLILFERLWHKKDKKNKQKKKYLGSWDVNRHLQVRDPEKPLWVQ